MINCDLCMWEKPEAHTWDRVSESEISRNVHNQSLIKCKCFGERIVRVKTEVDKVGKKAINT